MCLVGGLVDLMEKSFALECRLTGTISGNYIMNRTCSSLEKCPWSDTANSFSTIS